MQKIFLIFYYIHVKNWEWGKLIQKPDLLIDRIFSLISNLYNGISYLVSEEPVRRHVFIDAFQRRNRRNYPLGDLFLGHSLADGAIESHSGSVASVGNWVD